MKLTDDGLDEGQTTLFRDVITLMMVVFIVMIVLMVPWLNPPIIPVPDEEIQSPGGVMFTIAWPDGAAADLDMWIRQPNVRSGATVTYEIINYGRKHSPIFDILQDDLGQLGDTVTDKNSEYAFARELYNGHYEFSVRLYSIKSDRPPIPVAVNLVLIGEETSVLLDDVAYLYRTGETIMVLSFDYEDGVITNVTYYLE